MRLVLAPDLGMLAETAAHRFAAIADAAIAARGRFSCALAPGALADRMLACLPEGEVEWSRVFLFHGRKRRAPQLSTHIACANAKRMEVGDDPWSTGIRGELGPDARLDLVIVDVHRGGRLVATAPELDAPEFLVQNARQIWLVAIGPSLAGTVHGAIEHPTGTSAAAALTRRAKDVTWLLDEGAAQDLRGSSVDSSP